MTQLTIIELKNPLAIKENGEEWLGRIAGGARNGFVRFASPEHCLRAGIRILRTYRKRGWDTPAEIISAWAPRSDRNPTEQYIQTLSAELGTAPGNVLTWDFETISALIVAISRFETGGAFIPSPAQLRMAWEMERGISRSAGDELSDLGDTLPSAMRRPLERARAEAQRLGKRGVAGIVGTIAAALGWAWSEVMKACAWAWYECQQAFSALQGIDRASAAYALLIVAALLLAWTYFESRTPDEPSTHDDQPNEPDLRGQGDAQGRLRGGSDLPRRSDPAARREPTAEPRASGAGRGDWRKRAFERLEGR